MALSHLSQADCDKYDIYISNTKVEDNLDENEMSSAGHWETVLEQSIDLSSLLFMKSTTAEIALTKLTFDGVPLTYLESEKISINVTIPKADAKCNQFYNSLYLEKMNSEPLQISLDDYMTPNPETAVTYLNDKIVLPISHYIIQRYLKLVFDTDVFTADSSIVTPLSLDDIRLLNRYVDCALTSRGIIHDCLCKQAGITDVLEGSFTLLSSERINLDVETNILKKSLTLRPVTQRPKQRDGNNMDLTRFYGVSLSDVHRQEDGPKNAIETETLNWMSMIALISRENPDDANSPLTKSSKKDFDEIVKANKKLMQICVKVGKILKLYRDNRKNAKKSNDHFFEMVMNDVTNKCSFSLKPKTFLVEEVSISIVFPDQASYVLGVKDGQKLVIGPIFHDMKTTASPKLTNNILAPNQTTDSMIRPVAKVIYLATNLVSSLSRDLWLSNTKYASYHLIYCHVIDDNTISSKFICKDNDDKTFFKINSLKNILNSFEILVLDHNFRRVVFPKKTYVKLALTVQPTKSD